MGVLRKPRNGRWEAFVTIDRQRLSLGHFADPKDAAIARDRVLRGLDAPREKLNFPTESHKPATIEQMRARSRAQTKQAQSSRYRGVYYYEGNSPARPWHAILGNRIKLGCWRTEHAAAVAHDRAALYYLGAEARRNFTFDVKPADARELHRIVRRERKAKTSSQFIGVSYNHNARKWRAYLVDAEKKQHHLGYFDGEEEAAVAHDAAATRIIGKRATLNFDPTTGEALYGKRVAR